MPRLGRVPFILAGRLPAPVAHKRLSLCGDFLWLPQSALLFPSPVVSLAIRLLEPIPLEKEREFGVFFSVEFV